MTPSPAAGPPTVAVAAGEPPLGAARRDAARHGGVAADAVVLKSVQPAGWDGCLGISVPQQPCSQLFVAGEVALFAAGGQEYRYHIAGSRVLGPVDPAHATDGSPVPPEDAPDLDAALAAYAADDFAIANHLDARTVIVIAAWPASSDGTALVRVRATAGDEAVYALAPATGITKQAGTGALAQPPPEVASVELAMRQELARVQDADVASISVLSYHPRTWPNGCAGLEQPGVVCAQVVTPGFSAMLSDARGKTYEFRGSGQHFGLVSP
ncbi:MAG TPA: hypothetical protein VN697_02355 [Tepidiformaceae bacterium]|nr:hypothetical protein [Tepidiformaceae bacterium]